MNNKILKIFSKKVLKYFANVSFCYIFASAIAKEWRDSSAG